MTLAIARLLSADSEDELGTAFALAGNVGISDEAWYQRTGDASADIELELRVGRFGLTAFHCVGDRESATVTCTEVRLRFPDGSERAAHVRDGDALLDVALFELTESIPDACEPVSVGHTTPRGGTQFFARGYPAELSETGLFTASGEIKAVDATVFGAAALELYVREAAAELSLHGLSGAPVLVGDPPMAVGVIRWNEPRAGREELAAGATAFATPLLSLVERWSPVGAARLRSKSDEEVLRAIEDLSRAGLLTVWGVTRAAYCERHGLPSVSEPQAVMQPPAVSLLDVCNLAANERPRLEAVRARWPYAEQLEVRDAVACLSVMDRDLDHLAAMAPMLRFGQAPGIGEHREYLSMALRSLRDSAAELAAVSERAFNDRKSLRDPNSGPWTDVASSQRVIQNAVRNQQTISEIDGFLEEPPRIEPLS